MLSEQDFKEVVRNTPLIAIDLIIEDRNKDIILGRRKNSPAQGYYFVPGGRIYKNEDLNYAFRRIFETEIGLGVTEITSKNILGIYNHIYEENFFEACDFGTHYIVIAYKIKLNHSGALLYLPNDQHKEYIFINSIRLLKSDNVHKYVKNYFIENPINKLN